jgi:nitrite reductase/ring-hydroxylating ferredoxin subunit
VILLARLEALADPCALAIEVERDGSILRLILTRSGERVGAFRNKCPHAGYPLQRADGRILVQQGRYIVCGAHGASFTLTDGVCAGGPCNGDNLEAVAVHVSNGAVFLA